MKFILVTYMRIRIATYVYLGSIEDVLYREHRHYGEYLLTAAEVDTLDEHLTELRGERELCHPPTQSSEEPLIVKS